MTDWPPPLSASRNLIAEARAFRNNADLLTEFVMQQLVNRVDVCGAYIALDRREDGKPNVWTWPAKADRGRKQLSASHIHRHFTPRSKADIRGLHSTSADNRSIFVVFDFDNHGDVPPEYLERMRLAVEALAEWLAEHSCAVFLEDSNGKGDFHLWVIFHVPVATPALFHWFTPAVQRARETFGVEIESYPKQPRVDGGYGNWIRIFGEHHTSDHVSRIARPGTPWLTGKDAVHAILNCPLTPASVVPPYVEPEPELQGVQYGPDFDNAPRDRASLIQAYLRKLPNSGPGARSDRLFMLARFLRHGAQCTTEEALPVMQYWNAQNSPPLPSVKIEETWVNSGRYASKPYSLRATRAIRAA